MSKFYKIAKIQKEQNQKIVKANQLSNLLVDLQENQAFRFIEGNNGYSFTTDFITLADILSILDKKGVKYQPAGKRVFIPNNQDQNKIIEAFNDINNTTRENKWQDFIE